MNTFHVRKTGDVILLKSEKLKVDINLKSGKIAFETLSGTSLLS